MAYVISDDCIACGTCILSIRICVQSAELVLMLVLLKLFILAKQYNFVL